MRPIHSQMLPFFSPCAGKNFIQSHSASACFTATSIYSERAPTLSVCQTAHRRQNACHVKTFLYEFNHIHHLSELFHVNGHLSCSRPAPYFWQRRLHTYLFSVVHPSINPTIPPNIPPNHALPGRTLIVHVSMEVPQQNALPAHPSLFGA